MLFMIELHYTAEHRDAASRYFLDHGATHHKGHVTLKDAWIATRDHVAYVLARAPDQEEVDKAVEPLKRFGRVNYRHVTSTDEI